MKKPWLAALLNVVPLGLGYLYVGHTGMFIGTLFLGIGALFTGIIIGPVIIDGALSGVEECLAGFSDGCPRPSWAYAAIIVGWAFPPLLISLFTALGARRRAITTNTNLKPTEPQSQES